MSEAQTKSDELGKANNSPMVSSNCWWGSIGENADAVKMCNQVFNRFHITPEGYFSICGAQRANLLVAADLNKVSLLEAWNCETAQKIRKYFLDKYLPVNIQCYNCQRNANLQAAPLCDWAMEK